jgi:hypothetical protein
MKDPIAMLNKFSEALSERKLSLDDLVGFEKKRNTSREAVVKYTFKDNSTFYIKTYESLREKTYVNALGGLPFSSIVAAADDSYLEEELKGMPLEESAERIPTETLGRLLAERYNCFHSIGYVYGDTIDCHWFYNNSGIRITDFGGVAPIIDAGENVKTELAEMISFLEQHLPQEKVEKELLPSFKSKYLAPEFFKSALQYHRKFKK